MISQAVAFNMFLSFFAVLLAVLGTLRLYLEGKWGQELVPQLQRILPPGSWQLVSHFVFRPDVSAWYSTVLGWVGTLLVGLQTMKLVMEGLHMINGSRSGQSFLGRQLRALLLFAVAACTWLVAVTLSVFGGPLRQLMINRFGDSSLIRASWTGIFSLAAMIIVMLVLAFIYRFAEPRAATWSSVLPGAGIATGLWWAANELFGIYVRKTQFGPVYGGLAAVIGLLGWMELSVMLVFLGAAWNRESDERPSLQ
ncbi:MAG TPA: YihY/virulence factor BrkB family protein [Candidatus Acidoferrales bacterium]|nr:YihY/virulence factor BrkB family protein [Candidatus Acidoferrales bacterium]